jgi:anthranilate synthase
MQPRILNYVTEGGIRVQRSSESVAAASAVAQLIRDLDQRRGALLASSYEYPGRYKRYDLGFVDPPLALEARGRSFELSALTRRGELLLPACAQALRDSPVAIELQVEAGRLSGHIPASRERFSEEQRTRTPSLFSVVRALRGLFASRQDSLLGLYGAFGYDLVFQFEDLRSRQPRTAERELVLYLPDRLLAIDHERQTAELHSYEFGEPGHDIPRERVCAPFQRGASGPAQRDHGPGEYAQLVERAKAAFAAGDLFEVTPSQTFSRPCPAQPSAVFEALRRANPAPYGFLINLGENAFLVGASPEMYVRVQDDRVESCPIAGTIARGSDALADARQILRLLNSDKDAAELTMCTDVDRNDKARICEPGSVRVIGRRQIELYSRLIHTVDHVEGRLREGYDSLDAFLSHCWAVTVTGAPKLDAMQFIEDHERSARGFYGAAVGAVGFDGSLNTGLTLRTLHIESGRAKLRVGATLHFDSDPAEEERECELKASALLGVLDTLEAPPPMAAAIRPPARAPAAPPLDVLLIDHRDSFVHTLADYFRQSHCRVTTLRYGFDPELYAQYAPELVVLSPGPARPDDFGMRDTLAELARLCVPVFGVCLGLQGIVEFCGGRLAQLEIPVHGKGSLVSRRDHALFRGLPEQLRVGRYHSLFADPAHWPAELDPLAHANDGTIMAVAHRERPWTAVQFHPESILSAEERHGLALIENVVALARAQRARSSV